MNRSATDAGTARLLLVDSDALPPVYGAVLTAKELLEQGKAASASEAARMAGISRTAFYKYKDAVFPYVADGGGKVVTVHMELTDRPGVLSGVLAAFAAAGANILTVNQNIPTKGRAAVSISARTDRLALPLDDFIRSLNDLPGLERISGFSGDR